jgi:catechol 2,3-dioxygenase-like lactoylglutathione lyase family enzyme
MPAKLLYEHDRGTTSRRDVLRTLGAAAVGAPFAASAFGQGGCRDGYGTPSYALTPEVAMAPIKRAFAPAAWKTVALDHITFRVPDYRKEAAFYIALMGWKLRSDDGTQVNYDANNLGPLKWDGDTALQFRRDVLKPFFDQYLRSGGRKADTPPVFIYNTGENHWDRLKDWPLACVPEWSEWFGQMLEHKNTIEPLIGIGCTPVVVKGTKKRFLGWIGHALKRGAIKIPEHGQPTPWQVPISFSAGLQNPEEVAA